MITKANQIKWQKKEWKIVIYLALKLFLVSRILTQNNEENINIQHPSPYFGSNIDLLR